MVRLKPSTGTETRIKTEAKVYSNFNEKWHKYQLSIYKFLIWSDLFSRKIPEFYMISWHKNSWYENFIAINLIYKTKQTFLLKQQYGVCVFQGYVYIDCLF